jgi:CBS domain-containing protein
VTDALHFPMQLKLRHPLQQRARAERPANLVPAADLGALEREPLHHALSIVKRFRAFVRQHFRLDLL